MKGICGLYSRCLVIIFSLFHFGYGISIFASPLERQLEKFGTRVGRNEYVSMFKEPPKMSGQKPRTFALYSKLFVLPPNGAEIMKERDVNDVLPGGPLKFRSVYIPPATISQSDKIFFPKEDDSTTRKSVQSYLFNKRPLSTNIFADKKLFMVTDGHLSKYGQRPGGIIDPLLGDDNFGNTSDADELGWYTLLSVPPRSKKSSSQGCPDGHRRDQRGICRPLFNFKTQSSPLPPSLQTNPPPDPSIQ